MSVPSALNYLLFSEPSNAVITSWPGLTSSLVAKHLPKSLTTSKGHLRMQQQNLQSMKITSNLPIETSLDLSSRYQEHCEPKSIYHSNLNRNDETLENLVEELLIDPRVMLEAYVDTLPVRVPMRDSGYDLN